MVSLSLPGPRVLHLLSETSKALVVLGRGLLEVRLVGEGQLGDPPGFLAMESAHVVAAGIILGAVILVLSSRLGS